MTGTIKACFPKPGHKGIWVILIMPEDGSPDIYEEMSEEGGEITKHELPKKGKEVELAPAWPTWKVKF